MRLTLLGTGNASVTECFNTCFVLSENGKHFLVDTGGGNYILKALKDGGIPLEEIHDIFITHEHIDHLLGLIWLIRMVGQKMNQGKYTGELRVYCHKDLVSIIRTIAELTIQKKVIVHLGERILLIPVQDGERKEIIDCPVTFFDIQSTKAKQYGFSLQLSNGKKLTCCGDEPYKECERAYVEGSSWLMHEAFCLFTQAEKFKPYEKHHSTVKEACQLAQEFQIENLILYHTEDENLQNRKELYTAEGSRYFWGNLCVPDDMEVLEL